MTILDRSPSPPRDRLADWRPSELRRVIVRLVDGGTVQVGTAPNRDSAMVLARSVIHDIDGPSAEWPMVGNRILRPDAVLSVDVLGAA